jgi:hypothetical protein
MKIKTPLMTLLMSAFALSLHGQITVTTAGLGTGAFRVQIDDPFGTQSFGGSSANFDSNLFGWQNSGNNAAFSQMIQFDVTGNEAALNNAGNTITLDFGGVTSFGTATSTSLYFAALSNVDVRSQGNAGGNGLLASAALMDSGTLVQSGITATGSANYDVTALLQGLDFSTNTQVYFRFEIDAPTTSPGNVANTGAGNFAASTLTIVPEPSTYALLAGMLTLGLVIVRRRIRS